MAQHALITGSGITGRIPVDHPDLPKAVNVTPDVLMFDSEEQAAAVAAAIEVEHAARGTHPVQQECAVLDDPTVHPAGWPKHQVDAHRKAHKALNEKAGL